MLAIADSDFRGELVASPWAGAVALSSTRLAKKEFAGRSFFDLAEARACAGEAKETEVESQSAKPAEAAAKKKPKSRQQEIRAKGVDRCLILNDELKGANLYKLLGADENDSCEDIRNMFRKLALTYHPDKIANSSEEDEQRWVKMQSAFEILSDDKKRRQFDSMQKFDDDIPESFNKHKDDFFKTFTEVFQRNARWSNRKPVPLIGNADTPIAEVQEFYKFWHSFDSWRDPLADAQVNGEEIHDLEEAEDRYERRWMEQENARVAARFRKAERNRLYNLTRLAEKNDPRLLAHKERKEQEKEAKAQAEAEEKRLKEEAKAQVALEKEQQLLLEQQQKDMEKKLKQQQRDQQRRELKEKRFALLEELLRLEPPICKVQLDTLCRQLAAEECAELTGATLEQAHGALRERGMEPRAREEDSTAAEDEDEEPAPAEDPVVTEEKRAKEQQKKAEKKKRDDKKKAEQQKEAAARERRERQAAEKQQKEAEEKAKKAEEARDKAKADEAAQKQAALDKKQKQAALKQQKQAQQEAEAQQQAQQLQRQVALDQDRRGLLQQLPADLKALCKDASLLQLLSARFASGTMLLDDAVDQACALLRDGLQGNAAAAAPCLDLGLLLGDQVQVTPTLKKELKKTRTALRKELGELLPTLAPCSLLATLEKLPRTPAQQQILDATVLLSNYQPEAALPSNTNNAATPEVLTPRKAPEVAQPASAEKEPKKKAKDKAKPAEPDEDLDSLLAEFGVKVDPNFGKTKKKGKAK